MSTTVSNRFSTVAHALPSALASPIQALTERLGSLYGLSQKSDYVFASPLGPFYFRARHLHLPRFVYFGPHTHDESLCLAFLTGFDSRDLRGSLALLHFVERLTLTPDIGQGLNLSFFPVVDALGAYLGHVGRNLGQVHWSRAAEPEIDLLEKDARIRGYHGFVRIETGSEDVLTVRLRGVSSATVHAQGVELISSEDFEPWPVRWESAAIETRPTEGPLSIVDDLPIRPFELTLRLPASWTEETYREAVGSILKRFILRYRSLQAYGQYL